MIFVHHYVNPILQISYVLCGRELTYVGSFSLVLLMQIVKQVVTPFTRYISLDASWHL